MGKPYNIHFKNTTYSSFHSDRTAPMAQRSTRSRAARASRRQPIGLDLRRQDHLRADEPLRRGEIPPDPVRGEEPGSGRRRGAVRQSASPLNDGRG